MTGPAVLGVVLLLLLTLACDGSAGERMAAGSGAARAPDPPPAPPATVAPRDDEPVRPRDRHTVEVFFPAAEGDGLIGEYDEIFETSSAVDRAKQIVGELIAGPSNAEALRAVPSGTELRQAYVLPDGTAYLDFSEDLATGLGGGSAEELLAIYAIVNSVAHNVPEIRQVWILIEGRVVDTLNGHVDLARPLRPDFSKVLVPAVVDAAPGSAPQGSRA